MGAAVLEGKNLAAACAAEENDGLARKAPRECFSGFEFIRSSERIPIVWMSRRAAKVRTA